ncbi:MAG: 2OG-Fe(II) oxygenase family protein [Gammaproteobacteria bacterium]|nr:2OG-Fe(II) oxygenase family protein [Gammaproteobacteria bacterium]
MNKAEQGAEGVVLAYATPISCKVIAEAAAVNARLREIILERMEREGGIQKSNVNGWHSLEDLFQWPNPEIQQLLGWVGQAVKAMTMFTTGADQVSGEIDAWGWANVSWKGSYNKPHIHPDAMWSGVYYVDAGSSPEGQPDSGILEFLDPRSGIDVLKVPGMPYSGNFRVKPESGMIVLFPGWLYHFVNPYQGDDLRISIAFNVRVLDTDLPSSLFGGAVGYSPGPRWRRR